MLALLQLIAVLECSCTCLSVRTPQSRLNTGAPLPPGLRATRAACLQCALLLSVTKSALELTRPSGPSSYLASPLREKVPRLMIRDRADEASSACFLALCDGEHGPCSPRFPGIMMQSSASGARPEAGWLATGCLFQNGGADN